MALVHDRRAEMEFFGKAKADTFTTEEQAWVSGIGMDTWQVSFVKHEGVANKYAQYMERVKT